MRRAGEKWGRMDHGDQTVPASKAADCRGGAMGDIRHGARHQVRSGSSKRCFSLLENMKGKCIRKAMPGLQKGQVALGLSDLS